MLSNSYSYVGKDVAETSDRFKFVLDVDGRYCHLFCCLTVDLTHRHLTPPLSRPPLPVPQRQRMVGALPSSDGLSFAPTQSDGLH